ncbi:MAG TPA: hypothetical protein VGK17_09385 [Propionicimonas sp.]|jgi:hypothetical protein
MEDVIGVVGGITMRNFPSQGWVSFWEESLFAGSIAVLVGLVNGAPRLLGLQLRPPSDIADAVALDAATLAQLPLRTLAVAAARVLDLMPDGRTGAPEDAETFSSGVLPVLWAPDVAPDRPRGGSEEFSAWIAETYNRAHAQGRSARSVIAEALRVSPKRTDQLIREARDRGLLPEDRTRRRRDAALASSGSRHVRPGGLTRWAST